MKNIKKLLRIFDRKYETTGKKLKNFRKLLKNLENFQKNQQLFCLELNIFV